MKWRATDNPNDACCWSAHVETDGNEEGHGRRTAIADVIDLEEAQRIALEHNAHDALVHACTIGLLAIRACTGHVATEVQQTMRAALALAGRPQADHYYIGRRCGGSPNKPGTDCDGCPDCRARGRTS